MSRTLIVHPSPAVLRQLARQELTQTPSLTLVPNLAAGRSVRQLTRQALPTTTFAQHAKRSLIQSGWRPLEPAQREARLVALLERLGLEYYGAILNRPGTTAALSGVVRSLLRADASRLPPGRNARERDLVRLHRAWVLELLRDELFEPGVPEFFASRTSLSPQRLVALGFAYLDAAQIAYLDRLAADGSALYLPAAGTLSEAQRTVKAFGERGWIVQVLGAVPVGQERPLNRIGDQAARQFLTPGAVPKLALPVLAMSSVIEEVREVLRQVKRARQDENRPWHELAIVVRDETVYLTPLLEVAREYGVPLLSQARLPLSATPLGSLMLAWSSAGLHGWSFDLTRRVLLHPLLTLPLDPGLNLRRFGRRTPAGLLAWDQDGSTAGFEWPPQARGLEYLRHITALLTRTGVIGQQRQQPELGAALAALGQALRPLEKLPETPLAVFLAALQANLLEASVAVIPGKGGVRVMTPLGTLGRSFQAAWVMGLAEGLFPKPVADPPLLDAHLRAHWSQTGVYLPGGVESQAIEQALFFHALACARERLTLTRPETLPGGKPATASPFLKLFGPGEGLSERHAGSEHESQVLRALLGILNDQEISAAAVREQQRERGLDPEPQLPGSVDPDLRTWSASQLHTYGACRYHWFASRLMGLRALPQPALGLDPLGQGTLYHRVLERLLEPYLDRAVPPADELAGRVPALLDAAVQELTHTGEIEPGPLWHVERKEHVRALQQAVRAPEFMPAGTTVVGLEHTLDGTLEVGGTRWTFRGYADRVDRSAAGALVVTDYKLNAYVSRVRDEAGDLELEVQLPLYLTLLNADAGRYFSLKGAKLLQGAGPGWSGAKYDWVRHKAEVKAFLDTARQDLQRGDFRARPDPAADACTYCDMKPLCRVRSFRPRWSA